jgi:hypothetical protein
MELYNRLDLLFVIDEKFSVDNRLLLLYSYASNRPYSDSRVLFFPVGEK